MSYYGQPITYYTKFDDDALACPHCRGGNLHHEFVTSYDRKNEDGEIIATRVERGKASAIDCACSENPSPRRGAIVVGFSCELCPATPKLAIVQHKGTTYLRWIE